MLANLLHVAGINHVITIDLHASQMQGFFKCPVDNLHAEPLIARWIRHNVPEWREAVCVSKNAGGTKRVTSLADALKLNFGIVTTDRRRGGNMSASMIMSRLDGFGHEADLDADVSRLQIGSEEQPPTLEPHLELRRPEPIPEEPKEEEEEEEEEEAKATDAKPPSNGTPPRSTRSRQDSYPSPRRLPHSPLLKSEATRSPLNRTQSTPARSTPIEEEVLYTDERAREVTHGRLVQGHIVPDDYPSPTQSAMSSSIILEHPDEDPMSMSMASSYFASEPQGGGLGGTVDAAESDEEEAHYTNPGLERMITLVGDVRDRTVFIVDDMIDKAGSWIAAAETVVKRGGAKKVYCIATHGLFGGDALKELQNCDCIDTILVTNSFPIPIEKAKDAKKLYILDLSNLLSEAIRRNHYGESISALFTHYND